ncbi:hypothetical protein RhiirA5_415933 [Rhizophagus irregularis]|uniref:Uncharacterized protein n=1 Tax=Rhizophagus irregularis TaxID=588596 RepID=A0A2N0PR03_9GLOM|nr:hypothetical protein RhiirA5_415933 [Rhizophagus irregularis]
MSSQIRTSENLLRSEILIKRCVQVLIIDAQTTTHEDRCDFIRLILDYDNIITFNGMAQEMIDYSIRTFVGEIPTYMEPQLFISNEYCLDEKSDV